MLTAKDIRRKEFEKVKFGYDTEEVSSFLKRVEADYRQLEDQVNEANAKIQLLADKICEYKEEEEDLKNALLVAQKQARQIVDEAKTKAAKIEADAKEQVTSVQSAAMEEQKKQLAEISGKLDKENRVLVETQRQVSAFKKSLFDMYKTHLEMISRLPDEIADEVASSPVEEEQPVAKEKPVVEVAEEEIEKVADEVIEAAASEDSVAEEKAEAPVKEEVPESVEDAVAALKTVAAEEKKPETPAPVVAKPPVMTISNDLFENAADAQRMTPPQTISHTAEFDTRYNDLKFGSRRDDKKPRRR